MESSELPSPYMIKKLIILRHLQNLDEERMTKFKKALCQIKPPRGAKPIKMENLKAKSIEKIIEFIFSWCTERRGVSTITKVLKEISENQIRVSIERDIRNANKTSKIMESQINEAFQSTNTVATEETEAVQCSKNMETEKAEAKASKSKVIHVKQDKEQVFKIASITLVPASGDAPCSEPPAKKIKTDQEEDAVPGPSNHEEATSIKNGEPRPVYHLPKQEHPQSGKSLPNLGMEKETSNILATHLKTLGEDGIHEFRKKLCSIEAPFPGSKIQTRHIKDKSVEDMVDLIIARHTMEHAQATVEKVLERMNKNQTKMLIVESLSKLNQEEEESQ